MIGSRMQPRGEGELIGLALIALLAVFGYGLWAGGSAAWGAMFPSGAVSVRCYAAGQEVFSGTAKNGIRNGWRTRTLIDADFGTEITIDDSATCVTSKARPTTAPEIGGR